MRRNLPLVALALIFIIPFIAAGLILLLATQQFPTVQHGNFIPAQSASHIRNLHDFNGNAITATNKWQLVYLQPTNCDATCAAQKKLLQNLHIALGKEQSRVILASSNEIPSGLESDANIVLMDPLGNCIMYYTSQHTPTGVLKDLRRLLKYSHAK